jgi:predicted unusual protein kinase regulating ubiquinone biosynthesis (AarF/ABC1/UbiB family)
MKGKTAALSGVFGFAVGGVLLAAVIGLRSRGAATASSLPTQRVRRTAKLVRVGARTGSSFVAMKARGTLASEQRKEQLRTDFELQTAEQVTELLGNMRGAMMKLGQMASYLDQGLPEAVRESLAQLQTNAPPMAYSLVEQVILQELGAYPDQVFAEFERTPIAAASIGQVHVGRTHSGKRVAVKVQYPGVDQAIAADLENTDLLFQMMSFLFPGMDPGPIVAELRERLVEELDYHLEADHQRLFASAYSEHPYIHVPQVVDSLSTQRVLTTEFADGVSFSEAMTWSDEERQLTAECLYRFAFGSIYQLHAFNGDPHPGNYLFRPGGQITFLDFGLCKRFTPVEVQVFEEMIQAMVIDRDINKFRSIIQQIGILPAELEVSDIDLQEYFGHFYEFVLEDKVMEITPEYSSQSVRQFFDLSGPHAEIMKAANLPPSMVIIQRINLGLFALFGDLQARGNWRQIAAELWPFVDGPPSTPMGTEIAKWRNAAVTPQA